MALGGKVRVFLETVSANVFQIKWGGLIDLVDPVAEQ
jgi:hypothetical protein